MRYSLNTFPSIPEHALRVLADHELYTSDDLLQRLALPQQREALAHQTGLSISDLTHWVGLADLVRVKGMGVKTAELFILTHTVGSVQEFIDRFLPPPSLEERGITGWQAMVHETHNFWSHNILKRPHPTEPVAWRGRLGDLSAVRKSAESLRQQLHASLPEGTSKRGVPTINALIEMLDEAMELRPRLVVKAQDTKPTFRREMKEHFWKICRKSLNHSLIILGMVATLIGVLMLISWFRYISTAVTNDPDPILRMHQVLLDVTGRTMYTSMLTFYFILMGYCLCIMVAFNLLMFITSYFFCILLLNDPVDHAFYKRMELNVGNNRREEKAIRVGLVVFGVLLASAGAFYYLNNYEWNLETLNQNAWVVSSFGIGIGFIVVAPSLGHALFGLRIDWEKEKESFKRTLAYLLTAVLRAPLIGLILIIVFMSLTSQTYEWAYKNYILPGYFQKLDQACERQALLAAKEYSGSSIYEDAIRWCKQEVQPTIVSEYSQFTYIGSQTEPLLDFRDPLSIWLLNHLFIWILLIGLALMFVFPYISIGGVWRGVFYILLLFLASLMEKIVRANASRLGFDPNSFGTTLMIWFFILVIALALDWIYDYFDDPLQSCPACQTTIGKHSYCPNCGMALK